MLNLADQEVVPEPEEIAGWLAGVGAGVTEVRTGALFPAAAERFAAAGFAVIDTLALLCADLTESEASAPATPGRSARLGARHDRAAAALDRAAFGDEWGNDDAGLGEIRRATPTHHATGRWDPAGWRRRRLVGFAISGAAAGQGYLQRLAVDPAHQGHGHGRALTVEALRWMRRRGLRAALVNTAVTNNAALGLYRALGFEELAERLVVMARSVRP